MAQKLNVVSGIGQSALLGYIDPKVGMHVMCGPVSSGTVNRVQDSLVHYGTGTGEGRFVQYASYLHITSGDAADGFSWPTGDGSVVLAQYTPGADNSSGVANVGRQQLNFFDW